MRLKSFIWALTGLGVLAAGTMLSTQAISVLMVSPPKSPGADLAIALRPKDPSWNWLEDRTNENAPIDYGYGPGIGGPSTASRSAAVSAPLAAAPSIPNGGAEAHIKGFFGPPVTWPLIPIHMVALPDGRVLTYGTDGKGAQGSLLIYSVWDPKLGTGSDSHLVLSNTTKTDIFCGAQSLLGYDFPGNLSYDLNAGNVLLSGGDLTINGVRNYANNKTSVFLSGENKVVSAGQMQYARWYATLIPLRNGNRLILGGALSPTSAAMVAEHYDLKTGWRTLPNINIGDAREWYYPRVFRGIDSAIYFLRTFDGRLFRITTDGDGSMEDLGQVASPGDVWYPSAQIAPGQVLTIRKNRVAQIIAFESPDAITKPKPVVTNVASPSQDRTWSNLTVLPDGKVLLTGGSRVVNALTDVAYHSEIFDPATKKWTIGASAAKPRLYHSAALLLPDGTVLTGGGGAPGPISQLNAEIYYPPYLYLKDGSGKPAPRPTIVSAPAVAKLGEYIKVKLGSSEPIKAVTLHHTGSVTHSTDIEQSRLPLTFSQSGDTLTFKIPQNANNAPPGYYYLFVINQAGVPSVAKIISIPRGVL
jgi:hypothetical protein